MEYFKLFFVFTFVAVTHSQRFNPWEQWSTCTATCGQGVQNRKRECANGRCVQRETRGCQLISCLSNNGQGGGVRTGFTNWGTWSRCSKTCGQGIQERKRECVDGQCVQKESRTCRVQTCPGDVSTKWPEWSACSTTCGHGVATRTRQCPVGNCQQKQTKTCYEKSCPEGSGPNTVYEQWQKWSSCGATCGPGKKSRIRLCKELGCQETEVGACLIKPCPGEPDLVPGKWQTWGSCSASCGYGQRARKRTCIVGVCEQTQTQNCKVVNCPNGAGREYSEWEEWQACSATCGVGTHKRRRRCAVGLCEEIMTKTCFAPSCPGTTEGGSFLPWNSWTKCSVTCGSGERRRTRNCRPPGNCVQTQSQSCFPSPCGITGRPTTSPEDRFHNWEGWSVCSVTCGNGVESRRRRCKIGNCVEVAERTCRRKSCFGDPVTKYGTWTQWSTCSASCGPGEAKRTRSYPDGTNAQEQLKYCNNARCQSQDNYQPWMQWSGCSVSCDTGIQTRVRFCKVGSCHDAETRPCKQKECVPINLDAKYSSWQPWGECSTTCGFGFSYRKRFCNIGVCEQTASKSCRLRACPTDYTEWEDWSECSVTCGAGTSIRKRFCTVGACEEKQQTTCDMEKCGTGWEDWAKWQGCHKSCGGGFDYRIRRCKERMPSKKCPGDTNEYRRCNTHSCTTGVWGPWSDWGICQVTCGTGTTVRIRICEEGECKGDDKETRPCSTMECVKAHWSKWSEWSSCSVTCGKGEKTRSRNCIGGKQWDDGCLGSLLMKEVCEGPPCVRAKWSKWSPWRACSVTCGKGTRARERICIGGETNDIGCTGEASGTRNCNRPACKIAKWGEWSVWKICSTTCGGGITRRNRECSGGKKGDPGCTEEDEETMPCKTQNCPTEGKWDDWSKWSSCSVTCGIGTVFRIRKCKDGLVCEGRDQQVEICMEDDCVARWGEWSAWSICSATCGAGLSLRIRKCEGGSIGDEGCKEGGQESKECNDRGCGEEPPKTTEAPAVWSSWSDWSGCPVTCDSGTQSRVRICSKVGGCEGKSEEARNCNTQECIPGESVKDNGRWDKWEKWGPCPVPCGSGISRRTRTCVGGEVGEGDCSGRRTQHRRCKKDDCKWSEWGTYGDCTVTCGKGTMRRTRQCANGAMEVTKCLGSWLDVDECEAIPCAFDPNITCPKVMRPYNSDVAASTTAPYKVGTELTFTCDLGYRARGEKIITCQGDGRWSGPAPYCAALTCKRDPTRVNKGQICHKACSSEEDCPGISTKCLCDGWCGKSCFDPEADCEPLTLPENGYIVGDVRTHGYTVTYGCNDGYILFGTPTRTCRSDGRWTGLASHCYAFHTPGLAGDIGNLLRKESVERVINGDDSNIGAWPWQALLMLNNNNIVDKSLEALLAGGSVINKRWILTAAHVVHAYAGKDWKTLMVIGLGITRIPKRNEALPDHVQLYQPDFVVKHEKFDAKNFDYDICLIRVGKPLKVAEGVFIVDEAKPSEIVFNKYVRPVALPCISACDIHGKNLVENGINVKPFDQTSCLKYGRSLKSIEKDDVVVTGYGDKSKNTLVEQSVDVPGALQQALLKLLKPNECINGVKRIREEYKTARYTGRMLCTGSDKGRDACQGDSGGPLIKQVTGRDGEKCWVQVGIISWGWGCANADKQNIPYPGYYSDTSNLMPWIVENMKKNA